MEPMKPESISGVSVTSTAAVAAEVPVPEERKGLPTCYKTALEWAGAMPLKAPNEKTGPPPPTWVRQSFACKVNSIVNPQKAVLRLECMEGLNEEGVDKLLDALLKHYFYHTRTVKAFKRLHQGEHFMALEMSQNRAQMRRVRLVEKTEQEVPIHCWDIDRDVRMDVHCFNLCVLQDKVLEQPRQIFEAQINGLDLLHGTEILSRAIELARSCIEGEEKIIKFVTKINKEMPLGDIKIKLTEQGQISWENFYDKIMDKVREICEVQMPKVGENTLAIFTNANVHGQVDFQPMGNSEAVNLVIDFMANFDTNIRARHISIDALKITEIDVLKKVTEENPMGIFITKYEEVFSRIQIRNVISDKEISVEFIDYGNSDDNVELKDIYMLHPVDKTLVMIPPQFLTAQLTGIGYMKDSGFFWEKVQPSVFVKIDEEPTPTNKFHKATVYLVKEDGSMGENLNKMMLDQGKAFVKKPDRVKKRVPVPVPVAAPDPEPTPAPPEVTTTATPSQTPTPVVAVKEKELPSSSKPSMVTKREEMKSEMAEIGSKFPNSIYKAVQTRYHWTVFSKENSVLMFKITHVFNENDFSVQIYEVRDESALIKLEADIALQSKELESITMQNVMEGCFCALFYEEYNRWVRCQVLKIQKDANDKDKCRTTFRLVDYGFWISVNMDFKDEATRNQVRARLLPESFTVIHGFGFTAEQYCNPTLGSVVDKEKLCQLKGSVVHGFVKQFLLPDGIHDVANLVMVIIEAIDTAKLRSNA